MKISLCYLFNKLPTYLSCIAVHLPQQVQVQMIASFLTKILADPESKLPLVFDEDHNTLLEPITSSIYQIESNVPILLGKQEITNEQNSSLENEFKNQFNYIDHYNKDAEYFDYFEKETALVAAERKRNRQFIQSKIPNGGKQILDIGCGSAWVAKEYTAQNKNVVSLDVSKKNPMRALATYNNEHHAAVVADAKKLPFKDESFDSIIAAEIIEHLYSPKIFIEEWLRVLQPGGTLIMETPFDEKIIHHLCVHCNCPTPANAHLHSFNKENIKTFLPNSGCSISLFTFNNKWMNKLRFNYLFRFLPFQLWRMIDRIVNACIGKEESFVIVMVKDKVHN